MRRHRLRLWSFLSLCLAIIALGVCYRRSIADYYYIYCLEASGATVTDTLWDSEGFDLSWALGDYSVSFRNRHVSRSQLRWVSRLSLSTSLALDNVTWDTDALEELTKSNNLSKLYICAPLTSSDYSAVSRVSGLDFLQLARNACDDHACEVLSNGCHQLETLHLTDLPVSDRGIDSLSRLPRLSNLAVVRCDISDASVPVFLRMPSLTRLVVGQDLLSDQARMELREFRPGIFDR